MGRPLIRVETEHGERFLQWSTIVDAPVSYGMTEDQLREYIKEEYGNEGLRDLAGRIARCREKGTSSFVHESLGEMLWLNRAGPDETEATLEEIIAQYCLAPTREE